MRVLDDFRVIRRLPRARAELALLRSRRPTGDPARERALDESIDSLARRVAEVRREVAAITEATR